MASEYASTFACITVLTLDEDATMRAVIAAALREAGCGEVLQSASGSRALETIAARPVDVVLCECHLAGMDGLAFVRRLREMPRGADMPVIMLTASSDGAEAYRARALRVAAWLVKPIAPASLPWHVAAAIGLEAPQADEDCLQSLASAYEARLPLEIAALAELTGRIEAGLLSFSEHAPGVLGRLHRLKGQARLLGYPLLGEIAVWLDDLLRPAAGQREVLAGMGADINHALHLGAATMLLIVERGLRGDGGDIGRRIKARLGPAARDLQVRVAAAVAQAEAQARAVREQQALRKAEAEADRLTMQWLVNTDAPGGR